MQREDEGSPRTPLRRGWRDAAALDAGGRTGVDGCDCVGGHALSVVLVIWMRPEGLGAGHPLTPAAGRRDDHTNGGAAAVFAYVNRSGPGPRDGVSRLLPAFVECLVATGVRPSEVLAIEWPDVDLLADPPTLTITGTLIDHGRVAGKALHRQEKRKHGAPAHTVVLPRFGVDALTALVADTGGLAGPVFVNRGGGWVSLANLRRALRAALPADLAWVTPHSFRRTVATVVRDSLGPAAAQQQLSHAELATTEAHYYLQRQTNGPDVRATLDEYAADGNVSGK